MRWLGTLRGDTCSSTGEKEASVARRGQGLLCGEAGTIPLPCSHCSQLEQSYSPVSDPSWGRDLQELPQKEEGQSHVPTAPAVPPAVPPAPCRISGLSPGEAGQRDLASRHCRAAPKHRQAAGTGEGDTAG